MTALAPDATRTMRLIGDVHFGSVHAGVDARAARFQDTMRLITPLHPDAAVTVSVGDLTETGATAEYDSGLTWWALWPTPSAICTGNHDTLGGGNDVAYWETRLGVNRIYYVDHTYFRVINAHWEAANNGLGTAAGLSTVDAMMSGTTKPVILNTHLPPRDTHGVGVSPHGDQFTSTTPYTYALSAAAMTNLGTLITNHANFRAIVGGHTHVWPDVPSGINTFTFSGASRAVLVVNCGAVTYLNNTSSSSNNGDLRSWLIGYYLTVYDTYFETRVRNLANGVWMPRDYGRKRVETWAV